MTNVLTVPELSSQKFSRGELAKHVTTSAGRLEVRFAQDHDDVAAAQALRFRVFFEEMQALAEPIAHMNRRDIDPFDDVCDHLLVVDHDRPQNEAVVGTYRLLREDAAARCGGFYSSAEYDLTPLIRGPWRSGGLLELGRSCVHPAYRSHATIQLLWRGIARYLDAFNIDLMFGCASFPGRNPQYHQIGLSYLHENHLAPINYRVRAVASQHVPMSMVSSKAYSLREAVRGLPPLIKAYLRLGAFIGDGAVIDQAFGTTDVFILLPVDRIATRYLNHLNRSAT